MWEKIWSTIQDGAIVIVKEEVGDLMESGASDVKEFLATMEADLKAWTSLLENQSLSPEEFESLVRGQKDLATMFELRQRGVAMITVDKIVARVLELVITAVKAAA